MIVDLLLLLVSIVVFLYDFLTFPIYWLVQQPWKKRAQLEQDANWHEVEERKSEGGEDFRGWSQKTEDSHKVYQELILKDKVDTMDKVWNNSVEKYGARRCLGTRKVLGEEEEKQENGKIFKKLNLGEYQWITYKDAHKISIDFGSGLIKLGAQPREPIAIYAETREEWILAALGAFSQSIILATVYTNLGDDAVAHAINETEVSLVVTTHTLLPKFKNLLEKCPKVTKVVYIEDQIFKTSTEGFKEDVNIISFQSVAKMGEESPAKPNPPAGEDLAIIMYTSGSTGVPKGVMISHRNLVATSTTILFLRRFNNNIDMYIAYLPLAHVLELLSECTMILLGVPVGYSSPNTMTDMSTAIKKGQKGDATLLRPTIMCTVPLILDRIYKNLTGAVNKKGAGFKKVFEFCFNHKQRWNEWGYDTPILDRLIFNKLAMILGGRVDFMIVGSAPLSPSTQEFMRTCMPPIKLVQGYTMTETTCAGTCQVPGDMRVGIVGGPMAGMEIRLVDWEEGNYRITDKPYPRGEVVLGGKSVTRGYYKNEEKTEEDFFTENGTRYFRSGDIAELHEDGTFRLIDRKKDLVKLQLGEYVSLGKVEAQLKTNPVVDNICVYADSLKTHTVAIIVPVKEALERLAKGIKKGQDEFEDLCKDNEVVQEVLKKLTVHGKTNGLEKFEIPTAITLCPEVWMPESGLVTAAFKLKRKAIQLAFQPAIDLMYGK